MYLVKRSPFNRAKPVRRIRTIKEILGIAKNEDKVIVMTPLLQVLILFLKKKQKNSTRSNTITASRKVITSKSILGKKIVKTSIGNGNFHASDCN